MDFLTSVHTEHYIAAFFIYKFLYFIIKKYTVGCHCKSEKLIMFFLKLSSVFNNFFNNAEIHKRLSTKEIHFKVASFA